MPQILRFADPLPSDSHPTIVTQSSALSLGRLTRHTAPPAAAILLISGLSRTMPPAKFVAVASAAIELTGIPRSASSFAELAAVARMSPLSFHHHCKNLTALTPPQYQKQFRLPEARRLVVVKTTTATRTAFAVGYQTPSQFCREYLRYVRCVIEAGAMKHRLFPV
jgi:AraC-like DNA-binding protein